MNRVILLCRRCANSTAGSGELKEVTLDLVTPLFRQESQLLISPGAIDMAGVFVIPRKKDYQRVDAATLRGIYQEVTLDKGRFSFLIEQLVKRK